jgi:small subunit ribosomal protein S16
MKKMGRTHRAFFRVCAFDQNAPRDGKALEELGTYDPSVPDADARAVLNGERVAYWLSVGAQPSEKVAVLIKKYGKEGTHLEKQKAALEKLAAPKVVPAAGAPASKPKKKGEEPAAEVGEPASAGGESAEAPAPEAAPAE